MISRGQRPFSSTRALRVFWHFLSTGWPLDDPWATAICVLVTLTTWLNEYWWPLINPCNATMSTGSYLLDYGDKHFRGVKWQIIWTDFFQKHFDRNKSAKVRVCSAPREWTIILHMNSITIECLSHISIIFKTWRDSTQQNFSADQSLLHKWEAANEYWMTL